MNDKELYRQKKQAQLDEWKAEVEKLKARASAQNADARLELNRRIETLEGKIEDAEDRLAEIAKASDDAWESIRDGVESAWSTLASAFKEAGDKFKK